MSTPCENCGSDLRVCIDCDLYNNKYPETKIGHWIKDPDRWSWRWTCSFCDHSIWCNLPDPDWRDSYRFCPFCGTKMKSEDEE